MEGGGFLILYMVKKTAGPLSFVLKYMSGTSPARQKKREIKPRVQVYWMEGKTELPLIRFQV